MKAVLIKDVRMHGKRPCRLPRAAVATPPTAHATPPAAPRSLQLPRCLPHAAVAAPPTARYICKSTHTLQDDAKCRSTQTLQDDANRVVVLMRRKTNGGEWKRSVSFCGLGNITERKRKFGNMMQRSGKEIFISKNSKNQ